MSQAVSNPAERQEEIKKGIIESKESGNGNNLFFAPPPTTQPVKKCVGVRHK